MQNNVIHLLPRLRVVTSENVPEIHGELRLLRDREASAAALYLRNAADAIEDATARGFVFEHGYVDAIPDAKAGLFHLLTLAGCREADRALRDMLREE